jgi:hypothetical protein
MQFVDRRTRHIGMRTFYSRIASSNLFAKIGFIIKLGYLVDSGIVVDQTLVGVYGSG